MSYIPTPEQARELVAQYNSEPFHLEHAETVSKVLGVFAAVGLVVGVFGSSIAIRNYLNV